MTIEAKIIADSISDVSGVRITTYELEYPRFIHAEFMTHRTFSRNAASSRAIPVERALSLIKENTAMPIHWGKNQPGMSAKEECHTNIVVQNGSWEMSYGRKEWWNAARDSAIYHAELLSKAGYHKQIVNRLTEPFSHIKVVCTATEYDNFFHLRRHPDAQPEIQELANKMWEAREASTPTKLYPGWWHTPYFQDGYWSPFHMDEDTAPYDETATLKDALAVSVSCCAQVSYRRLDDSLEKAKAMIERLKNADVVHASPFEHQATPMEKYNPILSYFPEGFTGYGYRQGILQQWSGNFREWAQYRQMIPNHVYNGE
jgi:hypothetical protein